MTKGYTLCLAIVAFCMGGCYQVVREREIVQIDFQNCDYMTVVLFPFPELDSDIKESTVPFRVPDEDLPLVSKLSGTYTSFVPGKTWQPVAECILHREGNPVRLTIYREAQTTLVVSMRGKFYMRCRSNPDNPIADEPSALYQYVYSMIRPEPADSKIKSDPRDHLRRVIR